MSVFAERWDWCKKNNVEIRQDFGELETAFQEVSQIQPRVFLEIGAFMGGSLFCLAGACSKNASLVAIDICDRGEAVIRTLSYVIEDLEEEGFSCLLLKENSNDPRTTEYFEFYLDGDGVDLLHIDGSHKYKEVKYDYDVYSTYVLKGGMVLVHDICHTKLGTYSFWNELVDRNPELRTKVIHTTGDDLSSHRTGIGIVYL